MGKKNKLKVDLSTLDQNTDLLKNHPDLNTKEDDDEMKDDDLETNVENEDENEEKEEKKLTHKEKMILKSQLRNDVANLKVQRKKFKKTNFQDKKEKKSITKEIHEKVKATLKKK